jgi:raffinose/stachyose/melibiose transport system substrate-binding protein
LVICMLISFFACSEDERNEEIVYIDVATSFGSVDSAGSAYYRLLTAFSSQNKNIIVKDRSVKADDTWKASIRSRFESSQEPDVMHFFTGADVFNMIKKDQLVSLDIIRKEYPDFCKNISDEAFESVREFDGNIYAIPVAGFWEGLFCNTKLFEKYNVPEITDWNSLLYAIKVFSENGLTPIAAGFLDVPNYWFEHVILAAGGVSQHKANPKSEQEVPPSWKKGLELLHQLYKLGAFSQDSFHMTDDLAVNQFNSGQAAMILNGSWMVRDKELEPYMQVVRFPALDTVPKSEQGVLAGFTMGFYISKKAWDDPQKRQACVNFVEYMTRNESIAALCVGGLPAAHIDTLNDEARPLKDGITLTRTYAIDLPIDARLSKSAWEYLRSQKYDILNGVADLNNVLKEIVKYNQDAS